MKKEKLYLAIIFALLIIFVILLGAKSKLIPPALVWHDDRTDCAVMDFGCEDEITPVIPAKEIVFGAYDPEGTLLDSAKIKIDHYYYSWLYFEPTDFEAKAKSSLEKNRALFVTLEPWNKDSADTLLKDIVSNKYDAEIQSICSEVEKVPSKVYLSFGHEMDHDLTTRYPWSGKDKNEFIESYKYFVNKCKSITDNAIYVYSPVGDKKALDYWPGGELVDIVGFPVYSFPDFDLLYYASARTFEQSAKEKYDRLATLGKPMMIVELGVAGDDARKTKWIADMYASLEKFPLIETILFFNAKDHEGVWGADLPTPDWRINNSLI